jgi:hypothetical protein
MSQNSHRVGTVRGQRAQMGYFAGLSRNDGIVVAADAQCAWGGGVDKGADDDDSRGRTVGKRQHDCRTAVGDVREAQVGKSSDADPWGGCATRSNGKNMKCLLLNK